MSVSVPVARGRAPVRHARPRRLAAGGPVALPAQTPRPAAQTSLLAEAVAWLEGLLAAIGRFVANFLRPAAPAKIPAPAPVLSPVPVPSPIPAPTPSPGALGPADTDGRSRKVFVHVMPWFTTDAREDHWSYPGHDPSRKLPDGLPDTATAQHPLIGPYDSRDDAVIGYELLEMRAAGFDGAILSWYGFGNHIDEATAAFFRKVESWRQAYGFDFSLMLMPDGDGFKNLDASQQAPAIAAEFGKVLDSYAKSPAYQRVDGKPVVLYFPKPAPNPVSPDTWRAARARIPQPFDLVSEDPNPALAGVTDGAYGWVMPGSSPADDGGNYLRWLYPTLTQDEGSGVKIGAVYPGFDDSGVDSWTTTPGKARLMERSIGGELTLDRSWDQVMQYDQAHPQTPINWVNTVTWNDWNEGTNLEPSVEQGDAEVREAGVRNALFKGTAQPSPLAFQFPPLYLEARRSGYSDAQLAPAIAAFMRGDYAGALSALPHLQRA